MSVARASWLAGRAGLQARSEQHQPKLSLSIRRPLCCTNALPTTNSYMWGSAFTQVQDVDVDTTK